ncbi:MAG: hypothetical protein IPH13_06070 [Planctomycetes bacterium]|nr:hypothetical protein [Planctomycetota bacterium]
MADLARPNRQPSHGCRRAIAGIRPLDGERPTFRRNTRAQRHTVRIKELDARAGDPDPEIVDHDPSDGDARLTRGSRRGSLAQRQSKGDRRLEDTAARLVAELGARVLLKLRRGKTNSGYAPLEPVNDANCQDQQRDDVPDPPTHPASRSVERHDTRAEDVPQ